MSYIKELILCIFLNIFYINNILFLYFLNIIYFICNFNKDKVVILVIIILLTKNILKIWY